MKNYPRPWLSPFLEGPLKSFFCKYGERLVFNKGDTVVEEDHLRRFLLLKSGLLGNSIVNYELSKPFMMCGIRIPWQLTGYTTYLVREAAPVSVRALIKSELYSVSFEEMDHLLADEPVLKSDFMVHCGRALRSDTDAMLAIVTMSAEQRFWILLASIFMAYGTDLEESWLTLPLKLRRSTVAGLIYVSTLTIDRLYASLIKRELLKREGGVYKVDSTVVNQGAVWIRKRNSTNP